MNDTDDLGLSDSTVFLYIPQKNILCISLAHKSSRGLNGFTFESIKLDSLIFPAWSVL